MMASPFSIHWFRQDLRLADNPSLAAAAKLGGVIPVYILDDDHAGFHKMGSASRWWLHHSLSSLNASLDNKLIILRGDPATHLSRLAENSGATSVQWNRCYEPWRIERDKAIKAELIAQGLNVASHNGSLLWEPWNVAKADGTPYRVFTAFYRRGCLTALPPRYPLRALTSSDFAQVDYCSVGVEGLQLLPEVGWGEKLEPYWEIGEVGALRRLESFIDHDLEGYKEGRDFPSLQNVSRLSPHLHWGEVSPNIIWYAVKELIGSGKLNDLDVDHFLSELGWREFSYSLLYYFPKLPRNNLKSKFDSFAWKEDAVALRHWQLGKTGYPIVDAAMRQLWRTGYMHNRLRMISGSFLVKNLRLHWLKGEAWFWDCLVDADLASNSVSWQWIAGCGYDSAPYFRIFNPVVQGHKFDPYGHFVRDYVPEIAKLPDKYLFSPWEASKEILAEAGVTLGQSYPRPIVDYKISRREALTAFADLKNLVR